MKKIILGCSALLLGLAVWALSGGQFEEKTASGLTEEWFVYNDGDPYEPDSYTMVTEPPICEGTTQLCAVRAIKQSGADLPTIESLESLGAASQNFTIVVSNYVLRKTP